MEFGFYGQAFSGNWQLLTLNGNCLSFRLPIVFLRVKNHREITAAVVRCIMCCVEGERLPAVPDGPSTTHLLSAVQGC